MLAVGRKRTKNLHCPPGVLPRGDIWYWQPTSKRERDERKARGEKVCIRLGPAGSKEARAKWAEVSGYKDIQDAAGTVAELAAIWGRDGIGKQPNGVPRAPNTIKVYRSALKAVVEKFGHCRYGKTEFDASRGQAIGTADIQAWVSERGRAMENTGLAVLSNVFDHAIRIGKTTYNPCLAAAPNAQQARTREPAEWEVECLRTLAEPLMGLLMDYVAITGWRAMNIVRLLRSQLTAEGVKAVHKRGKRRLWEWTPELRRIVSEAAALPAATAFPASPVFPTRRGKPYSYSGFNRAWKLLIERTNSALAECAIPLRIDDLVFHDLRSKAHDDAEDAGMPGHELLANTERVAQKHYSRRARRARPLR